jgi:uncharacterized membrane protein HdeD (DUF308 family)
MTIIPIREERSLMKSDRKSWWLNVLIGVVIIVAAIFLLVSTGDQNSATEGGYSGSNILSTLVGIGVLVFCLYNIFKAVQTKNDNRLFIPYLTQGLLDLVLLLLLISIPNTPQLAGIIIACWMIVFGFFEIIHARGDGDKGHRIRNGSLLLLAGIGVLVIPLLLRIDSAIFVAIVGLVIGVVKTVQGFLYKVKTDEGGSGGRPNLY